MHLADLEIGWSHLNAKALIVSRDEGRVMVLPRRTKVLIYGAGFGKAQALDKLVANDWEVWCLNLIPAVVRYRGTSMIRADRWFDIHQRCAQTDDDLRWIGSKCQVPIYVPEDLLDAGPMCVRFPVERLEEEFRTAYWTCTFAFQIALALSEGFTDIGLYGVELGYGTRRERTLEWACVSWWMGFASARGVRFHVPTESRLGAHPYRYGFEYRDEMDDAQGYVDRAWHDESTSKEPKPSVGG